MLVTPLLKHNGNGISKLNIMPFKQRSENDTKRDLSGPLLYSKKIITWIHKIRGVTCGIRAKVEREWHKRCLTYLFQTISNRENCFIFYPKL